MVKGAITLDFDDRYPPNWSSTIVPATHKRCKHKCCWCLNNPAYAVHHTIYSLDGLPITGRELESIGKWLFSVCDWCHDVKGVRGGLHSDRYWIRYKNYQLWNNRNTDEAIARLRLGYRLLQG